MIVSRITAQADVILGFLWARSSCRSLVLRLVRVLGRDQRRRVNGGAWRANLDVGDRAGPGPGACACGGPQTARNRLGQPTWRCQPSGRCKVGARGRGARCERQRRSGPGGWWRRGPGRESQVGRITAAQVIQPYDLLNVRPRSQFSAQVGADEQLPGQHQVVQKRSSFTQLDAVASPAWLYEAGAWQQDLAGGGAVSGSLTICGTFTAYGGFASAALSAATGLTVTLEGTTGSTTLRLPFPGVAGNSATALCAEVETTTSNAARGLRHSEGVLRTPAR